jgi:Skp family chaperone for outer membrane proteins
MKKVFLFACVAFVLASCGNKAASNEEVKEDTVAVAVDSEEAAGEITADLNDALKAETKDPAKIEAALTKVKTEYAKLVEEGKVEEAKKYALKIQEFISNNSESLKSAANNATVVSLIDGIKNLPTSAEATAEDAVAAVKADAKTVGDAAKNTAEAAATNAANNAKSAAETKVNETKAKAETKVNDAANKAADKVNDAANKANSAIGNAANKLLGK